MCFKRVEMCHSLCQCNGARSECKVYPEQIVFRVFAGVRAAANQRVWVTFA